MKQSIFSAALVLFAMIPCAAEPADITTHGKSWTLQNDRVKAVVSFAGGKLALTSLENREAKTDYLRGRAETPLFSMVLDGKPVAANDGGWTLEKSEVADIALYGITWGKRLEVTLTRTLPEPFSVRQVFEVYGDQAGLRCLSFVKNGTDKPQTIGASDVFALNLPDAPHELFYISGICDWNVTAAGLKNSSRNAIACYATGDGWFIVPENNWATCLKPGPLTGDPNNKLLGIFAWDNEANVRVASNPIAVQVTLFPKEELEYFSVNFGVFKGDILDGRVAVSEHMRLRFKFHDPSHILSANDWQWGTFVPLIKSGFNINTYPQARTDKKYREVVVPQAKAAGFDRVLIDDGWYQPDDSTTPTKNWADMATLGKFITDNGLKTGHWFSLQGRFCSRAFGQGRDCADPVNLEFKMKQLNEVLIGEYHCRWDQVDSGPLYFTPKETTYSHPKDSVYRKILAMKRYMNTTAHKYPDFIMQTTCEIDNPSGYAGADHTKMGNQNVGLIHLADNGITGFFRRTKYSDNVRELFASVGLFPLEGLLSTHGEDNIKDHSWADSPMWYYQFLLARHSMVYSWPGDWSPESVGHLRTFNDWRKNPRIKSILNQVARPVYNGPDWMKNEGPWCWMFTDDARQRALVFAINHRELNENNAFAAKLRWLDAGKTYLVEEITQLPDGTFNYNYRGEFSGEKLRAEGLPVDLDVGKESCAAFWIQEKTGDRPQILYADAAVTSYTATGQVQGTPNATAHLIIYKPGKNGVEDRVVTLDAEGRATVTFDTARITQVAQALVSTPVTTTLGRRDATTAGNWTGKYGTTAAWFAGQKIVPANGFTLKTSATVYVWPKNDGTARILAGKVPACWTMTDQFTMSVNAPAAKSYRITVYVMDYDNGKRGMEITVKSRDGKVHDRQAATVEETNRGIYFSWNVTGPAAIIARKTEGINATISGVFVDDVRLNRPDDSSHEDL